MTLEDDAKRYWEVVVNSHPRRTRFELKQLLQAYTRAFPHREGDLNARSQVAALLHELSAAQLVRLPNPTNRGAYDHAERTALPRYITRVSGLPAAQKPTKLWRPELAFAAELSQAWHEELELVQTWLRDGGTSAQPVALRERSVEILGDEKRLDVLLGSQLFAPGRLTLDVLRCYLPTIPIYVETIPDDGELRPLLVVENHTTFDTIRRWNERKKRYAAVAFGAGTGFVSSCRSLSTYSAAPGCSGAVLYFGDLDPKGLWIPVRAAEECGIAVRPEERLYALLVNKARNKFLAARDPFLFEPSLLNWLPVTLREEVEQCLRTGRRLPQEVLSIYDLS